MPENNPRIGEQAIDTSTGREVWWDGQGWSYTRPGAEQEQLCGTPQSSPRSLPRPQRIPLSFAQQRLWLVHQVQGDSAEYNMPEALRLRGELDYRALKRSINAIVRRHEALRTCFTQVDGEPLQVVVHDLDIHIPVEDLSRATLDEQRERVAAAISREWEESFDLEQVPLLRVKLLKLGERDHILLRTFHHIICDGWSQGVFNREFTLLYEAFHHGRENPLPPLPLQYADFALWQRTAIDEQVIQSDLQYWKEQLRELPEPLDLPKDRPRHARQTFAGGRCHALLTTERLAAIQRLARTGNATLYMTLLAGLLALFKTYSGKNDIVIGAPLANRPAPQFEPLIGFFVNPVPLCFRLDMSLSFRELLKKVQVASLDAFLHPNVPFERLVEEFAYERSLNTTPLFQTMFVLQNSPAAVPQLEGVQCEQIRSDKLTVRFDLEVHAWERDGQLDFSFVYNRDLFDRWRIEQMIRHYIALLDAAVIAPDMDLSSLEMMTPQERRHLLEELNSGPLPPLPLNVVVLFDAQVERNPEAPAVISGPVILTYRDLNYRANQLAYRLRKLGVRPEVLVGVSMDRSAETIVALLGIVKAGGAYVPIASDLPAVRRNALISDSGLHFMVTTKPYQPLYEPGIEHVVVIDDGNIALESQECEVLPVALDALSPVYVNYTSGSTGEPKGVLVCHRNVVRLVYEPGFVRLGPESRLLYMAPLSFDAATFEIWGPLLNGGSVVVMPPGPFSAQDLAAVLSTHGVNTIWLSAGLFHTVAEQEMEAFAGVRQLLAGGDILAPEVVKRVMDTYPECHLINGYGPTECTTFTCCYRVPGDVPLMNGVPIGFPINHARVYVADHDMRLVPLGVPGELFIGGGGLARGYMNRPDLTAERFVPDPFGKMAGERLYRTGDMVRWRRDGALDFLGRSDQQVKIRGFRVEPGEIEATLKKCNGVQDALVIAHQDAAGGKQLAGYIVQAPGCVVNTAELRQRLRENLPEYMVPAFITALEAWPLTPNGKIDRRALPVPEQQRSGYRAPRTPQEEILCEIFSDVLAVPRVGIDDNFFDLGGHSLLATRVASRVRAILGVELSLRYLFESPTVVGLAEHLRGAEKARLALVRQERPERVPLSYAQQRLWFLDQLQGSSTEYNIVEALRLRGELDRKALEQALGTIVERHEVLRTHFVEMEGRPVQVIAERLPVRVMVEDLRGLGEAGQRQRLEAAMWQEREQPFDLGRGPLFRMRLLQVGEQEHVLLRTFHHIVSDGWSQGVFNGELTRLYEAFHKGEENPLEPLGAQYADFALWQRRWLEEGELVRELEYWKRQLQGISGQLELPRDHGRPGRQTFRAEVQRRVLGKEEVVEVKRAGQAGRATLYMTLLAGLGVLLGRYSGEEDLVVGTPIANRQEAQLEKMLGFFVNTLVLRMRVREEESFAELLGQVRETALEAYAHQDLPFERLVEELAPQRSLNTTPIYQVLFALQNAPVEMHKLTGLEVERIRGKRLTVRFDLELHAVEQDGGIELNWIYNPDLFESWRIEQMGRHYETLLKAAMKEPGLSIGSLEMLTVEEREQILAEWSHTACVALPEQVLCRLFGEQAQFALREPATIDGMRVYVLDHEMRLVPAGIDGELYIGGLANGHHEYPNQIAELFVPDPFRANDGNRLYPSGDLVRWRRDGNLELVGRAENQVKIRGYRVGLEEVEAALLQHPDVAEAAVLARDAESGGKRLVAYVVSQAREMGSGSLRNYLRDKLPGYMLPAQFHSLDALPKDATGKVDRPALLKVQTSLTESASAYIAPQTPLERSLAEIWSELLGLKRVGVDDNFFDVGGHSLLVIQLCAVLRQRLQVSLPIVDFFTYSTIRSLARHLEQMEEKPVSVSDSKSRAERHREHLRRRAQTSPRQPEKERIG